MALLPLKLSCFARKMRPFCGSTSRFFEEPAWGEPGVLEAAVGTNLTKGTTTLACLLNIWPYNRDAVTMMPSCCRFNFGFDVLALGLQILLSLGLPARVFLCDQPVTFSAYFGQILHPKVPENWIAVGFWSVNFILKPQTKISL